VRPLGAWWPLKTCILGVLGLKKTISSYSFDRIVLIFGYIVERTNTKILSSHFFAISILNPNYDVINDVISGFAKLVVERCGFHHWIAQRISCGEVVSVFMVALCNRADHYIFIMFLSSSFFFLLSFFPRLISAVGNWMFTILWHMMWP